MKSTAQDQQGMPSFTRGGIARTLITVAVVLQLVACGGGGGGGGGGGASAGSSSGVLTSSGTSPVANAGTPASNASAPASASATGSLALRWVAPVARADGTPLSLSDINGFRIYYGNTAGSYPYRVNVTDSSTQQVTLKNLASGTYYIVMTTYDVNGRESGYSVMVKKSVS